MILFVSLLAYHLMVILTPARNYLQYRLKLIFISFCIKLFFFFIAKVRLNFLMELSHIRYN